MFMEKASAYNFRCWKYITATQTLRCIGMTSRYYRIIREDMSFFIRNEISSDFLWHESFM